MITQKTRQNDKAWYYFCRNYIGRKLTTLETSQYPIKDNLEIHKKDHFHLHSLLVMHNFMIFSLGLVEEIIISEGNGTHGLMREENQNREKMWKTRERERKRLESIVVKTCSIPFPVSSKSKSVHERMRRGLNLIMSNDCLRILLC